jgi:hypothetical protein
MQWFLEYWSDGVMGSIYFCQYSDTPTLHYSRFSFWQILPTPVRSGNLTPLDIVLERFDYPDQRVFPQQLPGPEQPAFVGLEPQQAVSPGPGNLDVDVPDREDGAEIIFLRLVLLQVWHCG